MINILTFNEWKESDDCKVNQWFISKKIEIKKWFETDALSGLEFDYFEFDTTNNLYGLYSAELFIHETKIQWTLILEIDSEALTEGNVDKIKLVLKGFNNELDSIIGIHDDSDDSKTLIGMSEREITENELVPDLLIELINEFKTEYIKEE